MHVNWFASQFRHRQVRPLLFIAVLVIISLAVSGAALAQVGGLLTYGGSAVGSLSAEAPLAIYNFVGNPGDLVTARVTALTPGLEVAVSLMSPSQQQLANSADGPFSTPVDAQVSYRLEQAGPHFLFVSSVNAGVGDFLIRLEGRQPVAGTALDPNSPQVAGISSETPSQVFNFSAQPGGPTTLSLSTDTVGFAFTVQVFDETGRLVALLGGDAIQAVSLTFAPGTGVYEVVVSALSSGTQGNLTVVAGDAGAPPAPGPEGAPQPLPSDSGQPSSEPPPSVCSVTPGGTAPVNLRSGPGTTYSTVGQLQPGSYLTAIGYYPTPEGYWYAVTYAGAQVWAFGGVINTSGPCGDLPFVQPSTGAGASATPTLTATPSPTPGGPTATHTHTPTITNTPVPGAPTSTHTFTPAATHTSTPTLAATATYTPSYTPTTPPPAPTAPPDPNFNNPLNIPLDSTASVTDFVSYPDGDTEDRVRWDIIGMNPNASLSGGRARLILAVSCFGTGTQNIQFFTGGQTYSCGQTIVDGEVTYDSRTGQVTITAVAGTNTYVQWVLTGTATRTN